MVSTRMASKTDLTWLALTDLTWLASTTALMTRMASTKASSMARWAWTERLAGLGCTEDGIDNGVLALDSMDEDKFEGLLDLDSTAN